MYSPHISEEVLSAFHEISFMVRFFAVEQSVNDGDDSSFRSAYICTKVLADMYPMLFDHTSGFYHAVALLSHSDGNMVNLKIVMLNHSWLTVRGCPSLIMDVFPRTQPANMKVPTLLFSGEHALCGIAGYVTKRIIIPDHMKGEIAEGIDRVAEIFEKIQQNYREMSQK